jgi:hypothetical protein
MAGLAPDIHVLPALHEGVDARDKRWRSQYPPLADRRFNQEATKNESTEYEAH